MKLRALRFLCLASAATVATAAFAVMSDVETYLSADLIQTTGAPAIGTGKFYGYRSRDEGPGPDAFVECTNLAETAGIPLAMVWGTIGCKYCSGLAQSMNEDAELSSWMAGKRAVFAYFKDGVDQAVYTTLSAFEGAMREPQKSAYAFIRANGGPLSWPLYIFCIRKEDGSLVRQVGAYRQDSATFRAAYDAWEAANAPEVADVAAVSNPLWIGERTEDTLAAGEWTMDLDTALARTAAQSDEAWTLVMFTGALWCPWCRGLEHYVLQGARFKAFVKEKNISLVCLDNPRRGAYDAYGDAMETKSLCAGPFGKAPTLLRQDVGTAGNGTASGADYLANKGITQEDAERVLQRNHDLGYIGGAYATPDAYRTGYPTCILLDKAGNVAGRWAMASGTVKDSEARYPFDETENLALLRDLVANASAARERNAYATTTVLTLGIDGETAAEFAANGRRCCARLSGVVAGKVRFTAECGGSEASDATFSLCAMETVALQRKDSSGAVVRTETVKMPKTVATGEGALVHEFTSKDALAEYVLKVETGSVAAGDAPVAATIKAVVVPPDPGVVGFADGDFSVSEAKRGFSVNVARERGSDGGVIAIVERDDTATTADAARYEWDADDVAAHTFVWNDGEMGVQSFSVPVADDTVWDGDQQVAFRLVFVLGSGVEAGRSNLVVTLKENDAKSAGVIGIAGSEPAADGQGVAYVKEGGTLTASLVRAGGSWGEATARLDCGAFATNVVWANKDREAVKRISIDVSGRKAGESFVVSIDGTSGAGIDAGRRRLSVHVVAADAPTLAPEAEEPISVVSFTSCGATVARAAGDFSSCVLLRTGGSDADGITVKFDRETGEVRMSGAARSGGEYSSTWTLVRETADGGMEYGIPVTVRYSVTAVEEIVPALAATRSWRGLPAMEEAAGKLAGTLDITVPANGRTSAKFRTRNGAWVSFAGTSWTETDGESVGAEIDGLKEGWTIRVSAGAGGEVECRIVAPDGGTFTAVAPAEPWTQAGGGILARWKGGYTLEMPPDPDAEHAAAELCSGPATASLRFTADGALNCGAFVCAGAFPNGRTFSGVAYLQPESATGGEAILPLFAASATDTLGASLRIAADGEARAAETRQMILKANGTAPYWAHTEGMLAAAAYEVALDAYGSFYVPEVWAARFAQDYDATALALSVAAADPGTFDLALAPDGESLVAEGETPEDFTFSFLPSSGVVRGSFTLTTGRAARKATFRGVVLPGWAEGCSDCGFDDAGDVIVRPFLGAAAWWTERMLFGDGGKAKSRSVKIGTTLQTEL